MHVYIYIYIPGPWMSFLFWALSYRFIGYIHKKGGHPGSRYIYLHISFIGTQRDMCADRSGSEDTT